MSPYHKRHQTLTPDSWRTLAGAEAFLALRSYLATARKHGRNPLAVLGQLFEGRPWLPAPAPGSPPAPPCPA
jgi:hypothetical protein